MQVRRRSPDGQWDDSRIILRSEGAVIDLQLHVDDTGGLLLFWIRDTGDGIERVQWSHGDGAGPWSDPAILWTPETERGVRSLDVHASADSVLAALVVMDSGFNHGASYSRYYDA
ncbi:MAG: hypothetical protein ACOCXJ_08095 [Planctomycetota bacterium]